MAKKAQRPSSGDLEILELLWTHGQMGIGKIHEGLRRKTPDIHLSTVATRVKRMEDKGLVTGSDEQRPRIYTAAVAQDVAGVSRIRELINYLFGGSANKLILHLLPEAELTETERKKIKALLDRME